MPKRAEILADQIRRRIVRGELQEGEFLPLESQMLASFAVSRTTLREAFRILETEGLISVMRGSRSGARILPPQVGNASRYAGFVLQAQNTRVADIYEVRLAIEPYMVRRLAEDRPAGAVERLRQEVDRLRMLVDAQRYLAFMTELTEFHHVLAVVSGVRILLFLTEMLQDLLSRYQAQYFRTHVLSVEVQRQRALAGLRSFDRLIGLIEQGAAEQAEAHWRLHIVNANALWVPVRERDRVIDVLD